SVFSHPLDLSQGVEIMKKNGRQWLFKVAKRMRGMDGDWFDFPTAATFATEDDARAYAERFAMEQGQGGAGDARIDVRSRRGSRTVATYYALDYRPGLRRRRNPDGSLQIAWERDAGL